MGNQPVDVVETLETANKLRVRGRERDAIALLKEAIAKSDDPRLAVEAAKLAIEWDPREAQMFAELAISNGSANEDVYSVYAAALDANGELIRANVLRREIGEPPSALFRARNRSQVKRFATAAAFGAVVVAAIFAIIRWQTLSMDVSGQNANQITAARANLAAPDGDQALGIVSTAFVANGRTVCAQVSGQVICDTANHYLYTTGAVKVIPGDPTGWGDQGDAVCVTTTDGHPRCVNEDGIFEQDRWWTAISETCGLLPSGAMDCMDGSHEPGPYVQVAVSDTAKCALSESGEITCWGDATQAPGPPGAYAKLLAHPEGFCALRQDGAPLCWGTKILREPGPTGVDLALTHATSSTGQDLTKLALLDPDRRTLWIKDRAHDWRSVKPAPEQIQAIAVGSAVCARFESGRVACEYQGWHDFPFTQPDETANAKE